MLTIISIILTFLLTGWIGNRLIYRWQHRNWTNQHILLGLEKQYLALTQLCDELANLSSKRLWRMRRLHAVCSDADAQKIQERLHDYDAIMSEWNEKFSSMSVRLALYTSGSVMHSELETDLQPSFVEMGLKLERLAKSRLKGDEKNIRLLNELRRDFDRISRQLFVFNRSLLRAVETQRARTYYGVKVELTAANLDHFSTWELLKALFKPGVQPFSIVRSAPDFLLPRSSRT